MSQTTYERLLDNLGYLKLKKMGERLGETIDFINKNELSFTDGLIKLTDYEIDHKEASMINAMVKTGGFPHRKELDTFDFSFQESINKEQIMEFLSHRFIHENQNIVFIGTSGVGKTHLATSIGISVAKKRMQTYYIKCHDLIEQLKRAKMENRLADRLKHFTKYKLLIIDEIGYLPIDKEDSKLFFQLSDKRYERKSTIFTTNINFSEWGAVFRDPVIANAILDRVLHHAHVIQITGKSYRLKDYFIDDDVS
jgi:DNA replication protein DnaC